MTVPKTIRVLVTLTTVAVAAWLLWLVIQRNEDRPWTRDGQVRANIIMLASELQGRIVEVNVKDNQFVEEGAVLLRIDPASYEIAVDQAKVALDQARQQVAALEASVDAAKASVAVGEAGVAAARGQIASARSAVAGAKHGVELAAAGVQGAQAGIAQAEAMLEEDRREAARADRLAKSGAGSVQTAERKQASVQGKIAQLDSARAGLSKARASKAEANQNLAAAEAGLVIAETGLTSAEASRAASIASLRQAEATLGTPGEENVTIRGAKVALENAELDLRRTSIVAPTDGWVTNLFFEEGNLANPGTALLTLVSKRSLHVYGYFKETQLRHIEVGDRAVITPMADTSRTFEGVVDSIGWAINPPGVAQTQGSQAMVPQVQPTFQWIRLAQRVPVRVKLGALPEGLHVFSGMTVSVDVQPGD